MKEELTKEMHSEFNITRDDDICNKVGSAIQFARILGLKTKEDFKNELKEYGVTIDDYYRYKVFWEEAGLKIVLDE